MGEFLSPAWFANLSRVLGSIVVGGPDDPPLALGQVVTGTARGTVCFTTVLGAGRPGVLVPDTVEGAAVTLVEDLESARSVVDGESVAHLLASGRIKVRGDLNALLAASDELTAFGQALSQVAP